MQLQSVSELDCFGSQGLGANIDKYRALLRQVSSDFDCQTLQWVTSPANDIRLLCKSAQNVCIDLVGMAL
jgi:hypothetical protein